MRRLLIFVTVALSALAVPASRPSGSGYRGITMTRSRSGSRRSAAHSSSAARKDHRYWSSRYTSRDARRNDLMYARAMLRTYDRLVIPVLRKAERGRKPRFGQSVFAVARIRGC